ncbi:DEAD/DEAH box helicase [Pseudomonas marginalis]|uniref:DEAD/DEAH box helicase n=1 Tax=Pseudomonas TaxID=286 RepID=UPI00389A3033
MIRDSESLPLEASRDKDFVETYDNLLKHLFLSKQAGVTEEISVSPQKLQHATWLASIISLSKSEALKNLANSFGALLYLYAPTNPTYQRACYILQSRSGNLLSSKHIPNIFADGKYLSSFGTLLDLELGTTRGRLTHELAGAGKFVFTDYQAKLWYAIQSGSNVAISAPTSAGKSFIIRRYIVEKLRANAETAIFIVPTKALINQVSMDFKSDLKDDAHVYTTYRPQEEDGKSTIYVLTPERCNKLLQDKTTRAPSIIFIDEVHNLEAEGRGMVFENCLYGLVARFPQSQFIFAGPFIEDIVTPLKELSGLEIIDETTVATPVFQVRAAITFLPRSLTAEYRIFSQTGNIISGDTNLTKKLFSKAKIKKGEAIATFLQNLKQGESCIIFAPRKTTAESWALELPRSNNANVEQSEAIGELIDFLPEEIHPDYSLIRTLKNGVAFHHAGLPDIARIEIEELYSQEAITSLVCTSTLLQGVNLPADKLIVISPKNDTTPLTPFEFKNLIGRAGRISTNLYGEVYCLEVKDEEWGEARLTNDDKTKIKPNTTAILQEHADTLIRLATATRSEIVEDLEGGNLYTTICYLRHLFVSDEKHFDRILDTSEISDERRKLLEGQLAAIKDQLSIPLELLRQNPYVDPLLQNQLYLDILADPYAWIPTSFPNSKRSTTPSEEVAFEDQSFYEQFDDIARRLDAIFHIEAEVNSKWGEYIGIGPLVYDAFQWMSGKPHRYFIDKFLDKLSKNPEAINQGDESDSGSKRRSVDRAASHVTKNISSNITFKLVKYFSLWSDITRACLPEAEHEEHAYALSLPSMIELGSYDPRVLELMSLGINRSIALKLRKDLPKNVENIEEWLKKYNTSRLSPLLRRYLERSGLTKQNNL